MSSQRVTALSAAATPTDRASGSTSEVPPGDRRGFRADIEGLRAIAVLAVVLDHFFLWPRGGFVGVDIFFVISGFLITGLLIKEYDRTGTISFVDFYKRRVRRIIPAALLVLIVTTAVSFLVFNVIRAQSTLWDGIWSALFVGNWSFAITGTDYFAADGPVSPFRHYWSLSVEEQFYLIWPWLMLLLIGLAGRRAGRRNRRRAVMLSIGGAILVIIAASLVWGFIESTESPTLAYFSTFSRAWELGVGALLAVAATKVARIPAGLRPILAYLGLAGIVVSFITISGDDAFPVPGAILPVLSVALVIASGVGGVAPALWPITNPVATYIGRLSFSLYLWHFPVIVLLGSVLPEGDIAYYLTAIALTIVLSVGSFHLIEDPIRRSSWLDPKKSRRRRGHRSGVSNRTTVVSLAIVGALVVGVVTVAAFRGAPSPDSALTARSSTEEPTVDASASPLEQRVEAVRMALAADEWPALNPDIGQFGDTGRDVIAPEWTQDGCLGSDDARVDDATENTEFCVYGPADAPADRTAVIFGDSLAISYAPMVRSALGPDWQVRVFTMARCPSSVVTSLDTDGSAYGECAEFRTWAFAELDRLQPRLIFTSEAMDNTYLSSGATGADADEEWRAGVLQMMTDLQNPASDVIVLTRPPVGPSLVECKTPLSSPSDCAATFSPTLTRHARLTESASAEVGEGVEFLNTQGWFCVLGECPGFVGDSPVRGDTAHLTARQSESLAPVLAEALEPILAG